MNLLFVDTWFLVALFNKQDSAHRFALHAGRLRDDALYVTHDGILTELLTFFAERGDFWRSEVAALARDVIVGAKYESVPMSRDLFIEALNLYEKRLDKGYSLIDCMSMTIMRERGITHVLTNDHHFSQEGFTLVNA